MSLWEISFRTQYDYPFMKISAQHPGLPISMWCIWNREMIQVPTRDEDVLEHIAKEIRKAGKCIDQWAEAGDSRIYMLKCTCAYRCGSPPPRSEEHTSELQSLITIS